jgi:hypothetical protein
MNLMEVKKIGLKLGERDYFDLQWLQVCSIDMTNFATNINKGGYMVRNKHIKCYQGKCMVLNRSL